MSKTRDRKRLKQRQKASRTALSQRNILEFASDQCAKAVQRAKSIDGQKALRLKPTITGMVVVNPVKAGA